MVSNYDEIAFDLVSSISSLRTSKLLKSAEFYEEEASASKRKFSINGLAHAADESIRRREGWRCGPFPNSVGKYLSYYWIRIKENYA